ncbi:hypothetical protein [Leifsonia virtsii]|uniref:Uncharacterized protein n=1 Tax=Leifsonia virtsii TaxID=3035915 RepID=A0ABT8J1J8_9MICO|nr:hypothetical protein [Leifsonia virtsii]MDN4598486.1 hypothetical protein [Leifsonia virtsii]
MKPRNDRPAGIPVLGAVLIVLALLAVAVVSSWVLLLAGVLVWR